MTVAKTEDNVKFMYVHILRAFLQKISIGYYLMEGVPGEATIHRLEDRRRFN